MGQISFKKIMRDLWQDKIRTSIVLAAIILGAFTVSMMSGAYSILERNLQINYLQTNPASFTLFAKKCDLKLFTSLPEIAETEIRNKIIARIQVSKNQWLPLWIYIVEDFNNIKINKFRIQSGQISYSAKEILIERSISKLHQFKIGESYSIKLPGKEVFSVSVKGITHDPGLAPAWMEGIVYAYADKSFLQRNMPGYEVQEIKIVLSSDRYNQQNIETKLRKIKDSIIKQGAIIDRTEILSPGKHPHAAQMNSLMFLLEMFGVLTLFLSCFLMINMISAIMAKQVREIGIMKTIGASTRTITVIYLSIVLLVSLAAVLIALPAGFYAAMNYSKFTAAMLNFDIIRAGIPITTLLFQLAVGIIVPLCVTFWPVYKYSRKSVYECLNEQGLGTAAVYKKEKEFFDTEAPLLPISVLLALRNSFRKKGRLILTLITLSLGGAFFITSFNIRSSSEKTIEQKFEKQGTDILIYFAHPYAEKDLQQIFARIPGISNVEYAKSIKEPLINADGTESIPIEIKAMKSVSTSFMPEITDGKWLSGNDSGVVINHATAAKDARLRPGGYICFKIGGVKTTFPIRGITREVFALPAVYCNQQYTKFLFQGAKYSPIAFTGAESNSKIHMEDIARQIEQNFQAEKFEISTLILNDQYKERIVDHLRVITAMLIMITILLIIVGGLGLITTMSINILERRKEIGILRALGVSDNELYRIFFYEGFFSGIISWFLSLLCSIPLSYYLGNKFFNIFFETTINFRFSLSGLFLWLFIVLIFSIFAVTFSARNAVKMSVNEAIAYE